MRGKPTPQGPALSNPDGTEVDLWWVRVPPAPGLMEEASGLLTDLEVERATRFRDLPSRDRFLAGRLALRRLLGRYLGKDPRRISLALGPAGKPRLGDAESHGVTFNLSHSGEWVLLAFGWGGSVGVDVESVSGFRDLEEVAARIFTVGELAELRALSSHRRVEAFFRGWTRKEALLKALGTGLAGGATELPTGMGTPESSSGSEVVVRPFGQEGDWSVVGVEAPAGFCAAVAKEGAPLRIRFTDIQEVWGS